MSKREFEDLTPRELFLEVECFNDVLKERRKEQLYYVYYGAALQRVQKMPRMDKFLRDASGEKPKPQTPKEMLESIKTLHSGLLKRG